MIGPAIEGKPDNIVTFLNNHLTKTEFNMTAGGFTSENRYGGGSTSFESFREEEHLAFTG